MLREQVTPEESRSCREARLKQCIQRRAPQICRRQDTIHTQALPRCELRRMYHFDITSVCCRHCCRFWREVQQHCFKQQCPFDRKSVALLWHLFSAGTPSKERPLARLLCLARNARRAQCLILSIANSPCCKRASWQPHPRA